MRYSHYKKAIKNGKQGAPDTFRIIGTPERPKNVVNYQTNNYNRWCP